MYYPDPTLSDLMGRDLDLPRFVFPLPRCLSSHHITRGHLNAATNMCHDKRHMPLVGRPVDTASKILACICPLLERYKSQLLTLYKGILDHRL